MSFYQRGSILCRSGQQALRRSSATTWCLSTRRRWLSTDPAATTQDTSRNKQSGPETAPSDKQNSTANASSDAPSNIPEEIKKTPLNVTKVLSDAKPVRASRSHKSSTKTTTAASSSSIDTAQSKEDKLSLKSSAVHVRIGEKWRLFDPVFLRDCCTCPKCVDSSTRQKLFSTTDIPTNIRLKKMWSEGNSHHFQWTNDIPNYGSDHVTSISYGFLKGSVSKRPVKGYRIGKQLWTAEEFEKNQVTFDFSLYMSDDRVLFNALAQLHKYGLVFVKNVPEKEASVSDIATRIGPLKNTFYGNTWDVRSVAEAKNVAYTSQDLGFHMDLLYMHQPPRIQLLHCLKASTNGGTSLFSDSYLAAEKLFKTDRPSFDALIEHDVNFHYDNDSQHYHQSRRVIQFDKSFLLKPQRKSIQGGIEAINWSPPFQGPFHNLNGGLGLATHIRSWHKAARAFRDMVESESAVYQRQMPPGECVIFDNRRILHARTAFSGGERWLRGCYLDSDPLLSKNRVLERRYGSITDVKPELDA